MKPKNYAKTPTAVGMDNMPILPESAERKVPVLTGPIYEFQRRRADKLLSPESHLRDFLSQYLLQKEIYCDVYVAARVMPHYETGPTGRKNQTGWVVYPDRTEGVEGLIVPDVIKFGQVRCTPSVRDIVLTVRRNGPFDPEFGHITLIHPVSPVVEEFYLNNRKKGESSSPRVNFIDKAVRSVTKIPGLVAWGLRRAA